MTEQMFEYVCPYSKERRDSVHIRTCQLKTGICVEADWHYSYSVCSLFKDEELRRHNSKVH
jgi:hypothetical protein